MSVLKSFGEDADFDPEFVDAVEAVELGLEVSRKIAKMYSGIGEYPSLADVLEIYDRLQAQLHTPFLVEERVPE